MDTRTILFPTDFSERADKALDQAIDFGQKFNDRLIIHHVYHRPVIEGGTSARLESMLQKVEENVEKRFQEVKQRHWKLGKVNYEFRKELGISIDKIANMTKQEKIDLIIMATKGASGFGELWGTKTAKIIKSVGVPVLVIPDGATLQNISKIGLACDYSQQTQYESLSVLVDVADSLRADVDVIILNRDEKTMTEEEKRNRDMVHKQLDSVSTTFNSTFHNNIEEGIIDYCRSRDIGLIAVLPKSYNFIERLFHESLTEKMAFHSPIPLLVLK